jgi:branched-subunit amino acid transport protein
MSLWGTILGMALVTYLLRATFLLLPPGLETPGLLRRALRYVPAAVLTAIWAPEVLVEDERHGDGARPSLLSSPAFSPCIFSAF